MKNFGSCSLYECYFFILKSKSDYKLAFFTLIFLKWLQQLFIIEFERTAELLHHEVIVLMNESYKKSVTDFAS